VQVRLIRCVATAMHQSDVGGPDGAYVSWLFDGSPDDPLAAVRGDTPARRFRDKFARFVRDFVADFAFAVSRLRRRSAPTSSRRTCKSRVFHRFVNDLLLQGPHASAYHCVPRGDGAPLPRALPAELSRSVFSRRS
jgi:hypothetical protein